MSEIPHCPPDPRIVDTFAETFEMVCTRLLVTALDSYWLDQARQAFCGYATSVIGCDAECGLEELLAPDRTPDGRPGMALLVFGFSRKKLAEAVANRTGQCLLTCPTTAVFNGMESDETLDLGRNLRFFGDGFQKSKLLGQRRFWRVPVMDGEFLVEQSAGISRGIAGGNFVLAAAEAETALAAGRAAVAAIAGVAGCITPFPGGIARSGSKVGSRYSGQVASTAEVFCPTLRGRVESVLPGDASAACEIVIDAVDESAVRQAMRSGIDAALLAGDLLQVSAGNYGGQLGKCLIPLHSLYAGQ